MTLQFKRIGTIGERMFSFLIDYFIFTLLFLVVGFNVFTVITERNLLPMNIMIILVILLTYIFKDIFNGRSLGKRLFRLGVRCIEDPSILPNKWRLLLRNITLIIWPIEFFIIIFSPTGIRLGDRLAKTIVVKLDKEDGDYKNLEEYKERYEENKGISTKKILKIIAFSTGAFIMAIILFIGGIGFTIKNNSSYKTAISYIENSKEIISETGEIKGYGFMPTGSISISNGYGEAELIIKVKGEKSDIRLFMRLSKKPNSEWQIIRVEIIE